MPQGTNRWRAPLMLVLATAFWSVSFSTMKAINFTQQAMLPGASTWFLAALCMTYRFGGAALVMLACSAPTLRRMTRSEMWEGFGLGCVSSAGLVLQMDGLAYTSASTSAFLTQGYCLIIPLSLALWERRWPSPRVAVSCLLVIVGAGVLSKVDWRHVRLGRGEVETILASVVFTGQILWLQRRRFTGNNVTHFTLVMFTVILVCCLPVACVTARQPQDLLRGYSTVPMLTFLGVLVVFCTLGGYLLMNAWQPRVSATEAGLIYCVEPVFASLVALVLPGWFSALAGIDYADERLTGRLLLGGGLITLANVLIQLQPPASATAPAEVPAGPPDRAVETPG